MKEDYKKRVEQEIQVFNNQINVNNLPPINEYWRQKYIRPIWRSYGFDNLKEMYVHYMSKSCDNNPQRIVRFVSIGAGNCQDECILVAQLLTKGKNNFIFECLDLNSNMLERGKKLAEEKNLVDYMNFNVADITYWDPSENYNIIFAIQCLHHFVELEVIFDNIYKSLAPDGFFITNDMIGRNGHLKWPEALEIINELWDELPDKYKYNHQFKRLDKDFIDFDCSKIGFEGIRAQDILPLLVRKFYFELFVYWGGLINVFTGRRYGPNFNPDSFWDKEFVDRVWDINFKKNVDGTIKPTQMVAVMTKTEVTRKFYWYGISPQSCIRRP